jgi:segregation and condensation protein B
MENYPNIIESLLFASDSPLSLSRLNQVLTELNGEKIKELIDELNEKYQVNNNSFRIREIASGYQLYTLPEYSTWVQRLYQEKRKHKLSWPALETLSIIAYQQPVVKAKIEKVRGVDSFGVIKTLLERNLITIVGRENSWGRPLLYGTTPEFLIHFGLKSLSDLPKLEELEEILKQKELAKMSEKASLKTAAEVDTWIKEKGKEEDLVLSINEVE